MGFTLYIYVYIYTYIYTNIPEAAELVLVKAIGLNPTLPTKETPAGPTPSGLGVGFTPTRVRGGVTPQP